MPLQNLRNKIDVIDYKIHDLLNERAELALKVGKEKIEKDGENTVFYRPEREKEILNEVSQYNTGPFSNTAIANIFKLIITECRQLQETHYKQKRHE